MESEFKEEDWLLFKKLLPIWQESFMDRLVGGYKNILDSEEDSSRKFWDLERRVSKDKKLYGVVAPIRRSEMGSVILELMREKAISAEDLAPFSLELQKMAQTFVQD